MSKKEKSKIKLVKKSFTGELYDSNVILSKIPIIHRGWISKEKINEFNILLNELEKYLSLEQLKLVYRNIANVKVKKLNLIDLLTVEGYYDSVKKEICYNERTLSHEFLHMASSIYSKATDVSFSGLSQWDCKTKIGTGINEGYTELLNERIFCDSEISDVYIEEKCFARMLELFFDNPLDMMNYYFGCDLPGFIKYFEKFMPREDFIKLLIEIDNYCFLSCNGIPFLDVMLSKIYKKIYEVFVNSNPSSEKIKKMETIIFEDLYMYEKFKINGKKLVKKNDK